MSCEVHTWATFTDISLHGCYVEAQATYPVGTVLQMKLEANGVKAEVTGNVRVSYPYLGMGIAFVDMTEENVARLKEMLFTVMGPSAIMGPGMASSLPARGPLEAVLLISDPTPAIHAPIEFFESRQMHMRDDFLRILRGRGREMGQNRKASRPLSSRAKRSTRALVGRFQTSFATRMTKLHCPGALQIFTL